VFFISEREAQLTPSGRELHRPARREEAKLGRVWPHMLRHSCGYGADLRTMQAPRAPRSQAQRRGTGSKAYGGEVALAHLRASWPRLAL
jgi:hypothetical protein